MIYISYLLSLWLSKVNERTQLMFSIYKLKYFFQYKLASSKYIFSVHNSNLKYVLYMTSMIFIIFCLPLKSSETTLMWTTHCIQKKRIVWWWENFFTTLSKIKTQHVYNKVTNNMVKTTFVPKPLWWALFLTHSLYPYPLYIFTLQWL